MQTKDNIFFIFLCLEERKHLYQNNIASSPYTFLFVNNLDDLIKISIKKNPRAILIDMVTHLRLGSLNLAPIDNLGVNWPILRSNVTSKGKVMIICLSPPKQETFENAIPKIAQNAPSWINPYSRREHIRFDIECRVTFKEENSEKWIKGNCQNLSQGGCYIITYNPPQLNKEIEITILDLSKKPIILKGKTVWARKWEDSTILPGAGISFTTKDIPIELLNIFQKSETITKLISNIK